MNGQNAISNLVPLYKDAKNVTVSRENESKGKMITKVDREIQVCLFVEKVNFVVQISKL